jgi:hypothetical protein
MPISKVVLETLLFMGIRTEKRGWLTATTPRSPTADAILYFTAVNTYSTGTRQLRQVEYLYKMKETTARMVEQGSSSFEVNIAEVLPFSRAQANLVHGYKKIELTTVSPRTPPFSQINHHTATDDWCSTHEFFTYSSSYHVHKYAGNLIDQSRGDS